MGLEFRLRIIFMLLTLTILSACAFGYDASPFGMNGLNVIHGRQDPNVFANGERTAKIMKDAGMYWARLELWWGVVEPEQGKFDWSFSDKVAKLYRDQGMNGMCLLCYSSAWSGKPPADDAERVRYANYVYQMVSRYKDTFTVWEIWNEPNIPTFWPEPNVRDYTLMLIEAYKAAKKADPTCTILAASTSGPDLDFIKGIRANGGWDYCDGISIHPYSMFGGPLQQRLDTTLRMHQEYIASLGARGSAEPDSEFKVQGSKFKVQSSEFKNGKPGTLNSKPLWITEMGWTSRNPGEDRDQAIALTQSYVISLANGVEKLFWFCLDDWGERWGVVRGNDPFDPKPSYTAYQNLTKALGSPGKCAEFEGWLRMPLGVACYVFKNSDTQRTLILWSSDNRARTVTFLHRTRSWRMKDILGRPVDTEGNGIRVGAMPIVITNVGRDRIGPVSRAFNPYLERTGQNLIINGSMESLNGGGGADWWNPGRFEGSAKDGKMATVAGGRRGKCISISQSGERAAYDQGPIPVDVGKTYRLTGWIKTENATGKSQIAFFFYSGNMWTYQSEVRTENVTGTRGWTKVSVEAKVPEGTTFVRVNLISEDNTGTTWFDDISLVEE
jgi:hypothetical protein